MLAETLGGSVESKVISITLLTPFQIKNKLILEAANGWELCSIGTNFAFLQRQHGASFPDVAYYIESITLSLPSAMRTWAPVCTGISPPVSSIRPALISRSASFWMASRSFGLGGPGGWGDETMDMKRMKKDS